MNTKIFLVLLIIMFTQVNAQAGRDCPHNQRGCNDEMISPQRQSDLPCRNPWSGCPDEPPPLPPVKENPLDQCKDINRTSHGSGKCEIVSFGKTTLPQTMPILTFYVDGNLLTAYTIRIKAIDDKGNIFSPCDISFDLDNQGSIKASYLELDTHKKGTHHLIANSARIGHVFYSLAKITYIW